ncbi:hypothetical protein R1flu_023008 [Riccia fluitans]|uniref:Uncharacterized protein n=1 Tax=Riccia fluitans TaxID=41844 RepID=A0ABD1XQX0_9MARC
MSRILPMSRVNVLQERETFVNVSSKFRTDLKRQNLQRSRAKYFSPPKKPWDFSSFSQPKRLWDTSPPYRRGACSTLHVPISPGLEQSVTLLSIALVRDSQALEVQKESVLSSVSKEANSDSNNEIRTICGLCPDNRGIGRQRWHENALYQENPTEAKPTVSKKSNHQVKVNIHVSSPKIHPPWLEESKSIPNQDVKDAQIPYPTWFEGSNPSPKNSTQCHSRPSRLKGSKTVSKTSSRDELRSLAAAKTSSPRAYRSENSSPKLADQDDGKLSGSALSGDDGCEEENKVMEPNQKGMNQRELTELENLKVQMLLLCEKLALHIMRRELGKYGVAEGISSTKDGKISKVIGDLENVLVKKVVDADDAADEGRLGKVEQKTLPPKCSLGENGEKKQQQQGVLTDGYRWQVWRASLCIIVQILFWYFIMIRPVFRCIRTLRFLPPT